MKWFLIVATSLIYFTILVVIYYIHIQFLHVNVVFYAAIADAVIATGITGIPLFVLQRFQLMTMLEKTQLVVIWLLAGYGLAISVPTVIDRSLSFYILEKLDQRGGAIRLDGFEYVFAKEYMHEHRLVDVRLTEQSESGTIIIDGECVRLTSKGRSLANFSRFFRKNLLPKKRLLRDEYTDELIDPFSHSNLVSGYICE